MKPVYTVILAAGASRRLGYNKLLLKIDGETVIRRAIMPFLRPPIEKVFVVTGNAPDAIARELAGFPVEIISNRESAKGMSTSVRASLPFLVEAKGVFFQLGDKPFVTGEIIDGILDVFFTNKAPIVLPVFKGEKGHPVLIDIRRYVHDMELLEGDRGLREIIEKHSEDVLYIEGNEGNIFDIDSVEEINLLRERGYRVEKD
ncbi:MAG: Molybdenum cofactor cytidylyltransferase [Syntrophorhabdus sp. PtaU1.Bin058]|nr:MAG: Molybdenum cofactor cytidylyltransferase [Syntrophorhabdus sp. PtaU1.Bin058]